jgi:hypothetical protein
LGDNALVIPPPLVVAGLVTLASLAGTVLLVVGTAPYVPSSAALAASGLLILTVVGLAGMLVANARWSRPVLLPVVGAWLAVAAASPLTAASIALVVAAAGALAALAGPWPGRWLRRTPSLQGPSPVMTSVLLLLVATPAAAGLALPSGAPVTVWAWSAWSLALALALARRVRAALFGVRLLHPLFAVAAAWPATPPAPVLLSAMAVTTAALAWRREVRHAVTAPMVIPSRAVPFPPELVPPEVLAAAGLDDRGRPIRDEP